MTRLATASSEVKRSHLRNLVALAMKDGAIQMSEREMLNYIAQKWDIPFSEVEEVFANPDGVEFLVPEDGDEQFHQLYDMTELMIIDGEIKKAEKELCQSIAGHMGYKVEAVDEIVKGILEGNRLHRSEEEKVEKIKGQVESLKV